MGRKSTESYSAENMRAFIVDNLFALKNIRGALMLIKAVPNIDAPDYAGQVGQLDTVATIAAEQLEHLDMIIDNFEKVSPAEI